MKRAPAIASAVVAVFLTAASLNPAHSRDTPAPESHPTPAQRTAGPRAEVSRAVFNPDAGYLTFPNREAFDATLNALEDEIKNYKFDKGQTPRLVGLIRESKNGGEVRDALIRHSPLSEEVLLTFLGKDFPADVVGQVLEENVQFSEKVDAAYLAARLPKEVRQRIDRKRLKNIAYNNPVLQAFESRFAGFQSLRKKRIEAETAFLATGADPDVPSNPANEPTAVDDVLAAVLNKHGEVKVGRDVYISLPDKDVKVADGDPRTLSYIRTRGDIPRNPVPTREPDNGFARAAAPPPVDAGIEVEPNAKYNLGCGGVEFGGVNDGTGRIKFNVRNAGGRDLKYYWDFGDGFVSYKQSPLHSYKDKQPDHKVTVAVYSAQGAKCVPVGSGSGPGKPSFCSSAIQVTGTNGLTATFTATAIGGVPPYLYTWHFGDAPGSTPNFNSTMSHTYSYGTTYAVSVTISDANNCASTSMTTVTVASNTPPPPAGCDKRDKDKGSWTNPDKKHKFNHKFKLKNFLGLNSTLKATVGPHYKSAGVWWPSSTSCTVSMYGHVYTPQATDPCGTPHAVNLYKANSTPLLTDSYKFGTSFVSVLPSSIYSTGTAYGGTSTLWLD